MENLTISFLSGKGWTLRSCLMYKDFKDHNGDKYRISWHIKTHILYVGYGQLPFPVETIRQLGVILEDIGFSNEAYSIMVGDDFYEAKIFHRGNGHIKP